MSMAIFRVPGKLALTDLRHHNENALVVCVAHFDPYLIVLGSQPKAIIRDYSIVSLITYHN